MDDDRKIIAALHEVARRLGVMIPEQGKTQVALERIAGAAERAYPKTGPSR